ncbi:SHOC2, partial [Symbiodinium necroappetens]
VQGDRAERDRAAQPQAKLLRLPEDLPTSGQGSVPEFSEIVDKARRLMGPEPTDGSSQRHRATSSTASDLRGSGARDRRTDQQERGRSNMEQAADVGTSSAGRDLGLSNSLTGARDVVPSSDARRDEDGRDEHTRSRRQVSLKEADQASRGRRQSGAAAANALDEEIYSKALKLMGPDAVQRPAALAREPGT